MAFVDGACACEKDHAGQQQEYAGSELGGGAPP